MLTLFRLSRMILILLFEGKVVLVNIHINKHTRFQSWDGKTIFNEYPVHIRSGNFTVTLLFHDRDSIDNLRHLAETMCEIELSDSVENVTPLSTAKSKLK